jgi:hypothetical protein
MQRPQPTHPTPTTSGAGSTHWFDRLARHAGATQANKQLPLTVAAGGPPAGDDLSRRSIMQKGLLAAGLILPLRFIEPANASAAGCVGPCVATATKNYKAAEKVAAGFPQSTHPHSTTLEALNGTIIAAGIRADANDAFLSAYAKCHQPDCGKGSKTCGSCKLSGPAPGFHCCQCVAGFDSGSGEPNPVVLSNSQPCSDYCDLFKANSVQTDTKC